MHSKRIITASVTCAAVGAMIFYQTVRAQQQPQTYSPYPPGLIPSDLASETQRVLTEIDNIEQQTLAQWRALRNDSTSAMRQVQLLGKLEQFDKNLSVNKDMACTSCHMPYTGFSGPISSLNTTTVAYPGSVKYRFGKRKPQGYTYSAYYPALQYNETQGAFYGGNFWDLRATGYKLQSPDAEQAQGPPHDTQEIFCVRGAEKRSRSRRARRELGRHSQQR